MIFARSKDIERFAWFDPWLARGGQPSPAALKWLKDNGVRVIVDLRERSEQKAVERAGLAFAHIPVKNDLAPTHVQIVQWLQLCQDHRRNGALFVHCHGGEGRTSTFCAAVRLAQGVSVEEAIAQQLPFDFDPGDKHKVQAQFLHELYDKLKRGRLKLPPLPNFIQAASPSER
jgi:protein tyrosine phosphatase (PTP) superfamily phosphohydrolase (DUF442 family)